MRGFYKTKRFAVLVTVALLAVIIPVTLSAMGLGSSVRGAISTVLSPVQRLFATVTESLGGYAAYFSEFDRISAENEELKRELAELKADLAKDDKLERDYEWISKFIELKREHTDFKFLDATVTGRESGNYVTVFTIDRGTAHGVSVGMPVITSDGVAGSVVEVGLNWAKVTTVLDPSVKLGGIIERTGDAGLVSSDFVMTKNNECKMTYLPATCDVREGDRVMTSGYGTVYPRSLLIGTVKKVESDPLSQRLTVYIEPAVKLDELSRLMIITDYDVYIEEPAQTATADATGGGTDG